MPETTTQPDIDPRIGPHPFMDRNAGPYGYEPSRYCALWGCGRELMNGIHSSAPEGSRVRELAKAVDRMVQDGDVMMLPNFAGNITFALLHAALAQSEGPCHECGLFAHTPTCSIGGVMARYQAESR